MQESFARERSGSAFGASVLAGFRGAHAAMVARLERELREASGLWLGEFDVLRALANATDHRLCMSDLAVQAGVSPSGLTRRFDAMVARGEVRRERCTEDRRLVLAVLTYQGVRRFGLAQGVYEEFERTFRDVLVTWEAQPGFEAVLSRIARDG